MHKLVTIILTAIPALLAVKPMVAQEKATRFAEVVRPSGVDWGALNPARGALGPRSANLWGDRAGTDASGFLVKFADGFKSPPHIHNITYRGVVISGKVHNDDPDARSMWMTTSSYWTQPAGEVHITSAQGLNCVVYVEIQKGPYLVQPAEDATDNGESPINVHASNIIWLDSSTTNWVHPGQSGIAKTGPKIAFLWGDPSKRNSIGTLVKLPPGFAARLQSETSALQCVVVSGSVNLRTADGSANSHLEPGSYFGSKTPAVHQIVTDTNSETILYARSQGPYKVHSVK